MHYFWQFKGHVSGSRHRAMGEFLRNCVHSLNYTLVALEGHDFLFVLYLHINLVKVDSSQHRNRVSFYFS